MGKVRVIAEGTELDVNDNDVLSFNYGVADIRTPDKRMAEFTKSIDFFGSPANNKFFENTFDVNVVTNTWNPNLKTSCYVLADDVQVLKGDLKLSTIRTTYSVDGSQNVIYSCEIYGSIATLFNEISDDKLEALDLSAYDHAYTAANIIASWSATKGQGYVYPVIDYGYKGWNQDWYFHVEHLRPAIYVKQYVDSIFAAAGKTYTSSFLTDTFFKSLIIPHNGDELSISAATLANYQFYAGRLAVDTAQNLALTYNAFENKWTNANANNAGIQSGSIQAGVSTHIPNDDSTSPFNDAGGIYDTATGTFTVAANGFYNLKGKIKHKVKVNHSTAATVSGSFNLWVALIKSTDGGTTWTFEGSSFKQNYVACSFSYQDAEHTFSFNNIGLAGTNKIRVLSILAPSLYTAGGAVFDGGATTTGTASMDIQQQADSYFMVNMADTKLLTGNTLTIADAIPVDIKQRDFLRDLFKMFNLYVDTDPTDENNFIIEPRDDYYDAGSTKDWTNKWDTSREIEIEPMGALESKTYIFTYKSDSDYYNNDYETRYKSPYSTKKFIINNDFKKEDYVTELLFSPTPSADNQSTSLIIPKIFEFKNGVVKKMKHNIRILQYSGLLTGSWTLTDPSTSYPQTTYPYAGMVDNPDNPDVMLDWGIPKQAYYETPAQSYSDNNLFNAYHYRQTNEVTDRDSKIVRMWIKLTPTDVFNLDFRDKIFIKDAYYLINRVIEYNPLGNGLTQIEFLKLKEYPNFVPSVYFKEDTEPDEGGGYGTESQKPQQNFTQLDVGNLNESNSSSIS